MSKNTVYVTQAGYDELLEKLKRLKKEQTENIVALQEARAQGDLSENADYDAARNNQARIAAEIKETEQALKVAVVISGEEGNNLGKFVDVNFLDEGVVETYHIVGTIEADPFNGKLSNTTPLAEVIMDHKAGDVCTVRRVEEPYDVKILEVK